MDDSLAATTLASALYLVLLRYLNRQYNAFVRLVDTVATDVKLSREEQNTLNLLTKKFTFFGSGEAHSPDEHPDAHACFLHASLVLLDSPIVLPWDLTVQMAGYIDKLHHVSSGCRLSPTEELTLLKHCICDPADSRYNPAKHTLWQILGCKNRRAELRVVRQRRDDGDVARALTSAVGRAAQALSGAAPAPGGASAGVRRQGGEGQPAFCGEPRRRSLVCRGECDTGAHRTDLSQATHTPT